MGMKEQDILSYGGINAERTNILLLVLFALRNDYTYFFTDKVGITASHTHGVGLNMIRWIVDDKKSIPIQLFIKNWSNI